MTAQATTAVGGEWFVNGEWLAKHSVIVSQPRDVRHFHHDWPTQYSIAEDGGGNDGLLCGNRRRVNV
jgi:hypothetical protein